MKIAWRIVPVAAIAAVALTASLTGCTAATTGSQTGSGSSQPAVTNSSSPTPSAPAESADVASINVTASKVDLLGSDGSVVTSLPNTADPATAIDAFSKAFGKRPTEETYEGTSDGSGGTASSWDGFTVRVASGQMFSGDTIHFDITTTTADVNGIRVGFDGVSVGDSIAQLKAAGGKLVSSASGTGGSGLHDGDSWAYGSTTAGDLTLQILARIKSSKVGTLTAPSDANGA